jgi:hypothetical protein
MEREETEPTPRERELVGAVVLSLMQGSNLEEGEDGVVR